jgi:hypothetical protein
MAVTLNASTSSGLVQSADTSGEINLQSNGTTKLSVLSTGVSGTIVQGTAVASTSGTSIDFTGIPSWVKRITVMFDGVSLSGTASVRLQFGVSGTPEATGYLSGSCRITDVPTALFQKSTAGIDMFGSNATFAICGSLVITNLNNNTWTFMGSTFSNPTTSYVQTTAGSKTLAGVLNMVRITSSNGTDTFDAGLINIQYEG